MSANLDILLHQQELELFISSEEHLWTRLAFIVTKYETSFTFKLTRVSIRKCIDICVRSFEVYEARMCTILFYTIPV